MERIYQKIFVPSSVFGIIRVLKLCFRGFDSLWFFTLIYLLYYDDVIFFFCIEY